MRPGDFVIVNDVIGCIQSLTPLSILCLDGVTRTFQAEPSLIISGQHYALLLAEKAMRRIKDGNKESG